MVAVQHHAVCALVRLAVSCGTVNVVLLLPAWQTPQLRPAKGKFAQLPGIGAGLVLVLPPWI